MYIGLQERNQLLCGPNWPLRRNWLCLLGNKGYNSRLNDHVFTNGYEGTTDPITLPADPARIQPSFRFFDHYTNAVRYIR